MGQTTLFAISDELHATPSAGNASRTLLRSLQAIWQGDADMAAGCKVQQWHEHYCNADTGYSEHERMACTLMAAELRECQTRIYHVGGSRNWHIRGGRTSCLTRNHMALKTIDAASEFSDGFLFPTGTKKGHLINNDLAIAMRLILPSEYKPRDLKRTVATQIWGLCFNR